MFKSDSYLHTVKYHWEYKYSILWIHIWTKNIQWKLSYFLKSEKEVEFDKIQEDAKSYHKINTASAYSREFCTYNYCIYKNIKTKN